MKQDDGDLTNEQPNDAYTELYAAHQVHALAQLLLQRLQQAADPGAAQPEAHEPETEVRPEVESTALPLNYWYP